VKGAIVAVLKYVNEEGQQVSVHVGPDHPEILIGRNKQCDITTTNKTASRAHAKVVFADGTFTLMDLDSANGTFFNRERIKEIPLVDGTQFYCGTFQVDFFLEDSDDLMALRAQADAVPLPFEAYEPEFPSTPEPSQAEEPSPVPEPLPVSEPSPVPESSVAPEPLVVPLPLPVEEQPLEPMVSSEAADDLVSFGEPSVAAAAAVALDTSAAEQVRFEAQGNGAQRLLDAERLHGERVRELSDTIDHLNSQLAERDDLNRKLSVQVEDLGRLIARQEGSEGSEKTKTQIAELEGRLAEAEGKLTEVQAGRESLAAERDALQLKADEAELRVMELEEHATKAASEHGELSARIADIEPRAVQAETERDGLKEKIIGLEGDLEAARQQIESLAANAVSEDDRKRFAAADAEAAKIPDLIARQEASAREAEESKALLAEARTEIDQLKAAAGDREGLQKELDEARAEIERHKGAASQVEDVRKELEGARQEIETLKGSATSLEVIQKELATARETISRLESERNALVEENQRWDDLKKQFESERTAVEGEVTALRAQVAQLKGTAADAQNASAQNDEMAAKLKAATDDAADLKLANRSYLKKISKLLEEMEQLKAAKAAPAAGLQNDAVAELAALKEENARVVKEAESAARELAEARGQIELHVQRISALESSVSTPAVPAVAAPVPAGGTDLAPIRDVVDRVNEVVSEMRTALEVLGSVLPDMSERLPAADDRDEIVEQVTGAANDLGGFARQIKEEILKARKALQ